MAIHVNIMFIWTFIIGIALHVSSEMYEHQLDFTWNPFHSYLKPGESGYVRSTMELNNECSKARYRIVWTDIETAINIHVNLLWRDFSHFERTTVGYIKHNVVERKSLIIETCVTLLSKPQCISIEEFGTNLIDNKNIFAESFMKIKLEYECMTSSWNIYRYIIKELTFCSKCMAELQHLQHINDDKNAFRIVSLNTLLKTVYIDFYYLCRPHLVNIVMSSLIIKKRLCKINKCGVVKHACFKDGHHIYVNAESKYTIHFEKHHVTADTYIFIIRLHIYDFEVTDYGKYYCIMKHIVNDRNYRLRSYLYLKPSWQKGIPTLDTATLITEGSLKYHDKVHATYVQLFTHFKDSKERFTFGVTWQNEEKRKLIICSSIAILVIFLQLCLYSIQVKERSTKNHKTTSISS